ncbi:hypothetical protein [Jatrophihabitans fulvus]
MAAEAVAASLRARRVWTAALLLVTLAPLAVLPAVAPAGSAPPAAALGFALFVGSSVHVASSAWFYTVGEVREHMAEHPVRYYLVPAGLVASGAVLAAVMPEHAMVAVLLAFFAWQFWHFQKQNLGVAALAARAGGVPSPGRTERRALLGAGVGGTLGLLGHPHLLQVADAPRSEPVFLAGALVTAGAAVAGALALARRAPTHRPPAYAIAYVAGLLFFVPVWLFASPYAAVAGLTLAHGLQYLLLMALVAGGAGPKRTAVGLVVLADVAVLLGLVLNRFSHLHGGGPLDRALFGVFLGLTAAHFVVDAGLWRLRDAFPRAFLGARLRLLLPPATAPRPAG